MSLERLMAVVLVVMTALFLHGFWSATLQRHCAGMLISISVLGIGIAASTMLLFRGQRGTLNMLLLLIVVAIYVVVLLFVPLYMRDVLLSSGLGPC